MLHAAVTRPPSAPSRGRRRGRVPLVAALRAAIAAAHHLDPAELRAHPEAAVDADALDLLAATPVRTGADAAALLDVLARELVDRMRAAEWDEGAAPAAVTSVLAASMPAVEAVLLRAAWSRRR